MSTGSALSWPSSSVARIRDALRTLLGKRPKYTPLAQQMASEQLLAAHHWAHPLRGIYYDADVNFGVMQPDEREFLECLLHDVRRSSGPIVHFGTLLGDTIHLICNAKSAHQSVITIDPADANPWNLPPDSYRSLRDRFLRHQFADQQVTQLSISPMEYFRRYHDAPPALVFLNYVSTADDARHIIRWAKTVGAELIAGRGYDFASPAVLKPVDEAGGPDAVEGSLWRLISSNSPVSARSFHGTAALEKAGAPTSDRLVSIVMPAYNAREYIDLALDDVGRQIHGNWELVVVEDGSQHDVADKLDQFQSRHPAHRIVYHPKAKNSGVSNTRNVALSLCRGEFVAFLDADDRWSPDHLKRKVSILCQTGCDLAYSRVDAFDSATDQTITMWGPAEEDLRRFPESMFYRPYLQPSGVVVRQSLIDDVGKFDEELHFAEDYDYWFRAIQAGKLFCFDEKVTSRYRKNHATAATTDRLVICCQGVAEVTERHLRMRGANEEERRNIIARHYLMAGTGHLAFRPSVRNKCSAAVGRKCLREAWRVGGNTWHWRKYHVLALLATLTGTTALLRPIFRRKYMRFWT